MANDAPEIGSGIRLLMRRCLRVGLGTLERRRRPLCLARHGGARPRRHAAALPFRSGRPHQEPQGAIRASRCCSTARWTAPCRSPASAPPCRAGSRSRPIRGCSRAMWPAIRTPPPMPAFATSTSIGSPSSGRISSPASAASTGSMAPRCAWAEAAVGDLPDREADVVAHMNDDHADASSSTPTASCRAAAATGASPGWTPTAATCGRAPRRRGLASSEPVRDAEAARVELVRLVKRARAQAAAA